MTLLIFQVFASCGRSFKFKSSHANHWTNKIMNMLVDLSFKTLWSCHS